MQTRQIKVALVQQSFGSEPDYNLDQSIAAVSDAASQGAQLVVLPELHRTRYFCQNENPSVFDLAETIPGPTCERLASLAREHSTVIIASIFERRTACVYHNTAVVLDQDGSIAGCYRKMHIPNDPGYYEKYYFAPGDQGFEPITTSLGKLGVLICWDQWFPEAARLMALKGADILVYPTAIGWDPNDGGEEQRRQRQAWKVVQRGHAIANGLPLIACNRVGLETDKSGQSAGIQFWGSSFIAGQQGEILAEASSDQHAILSADVDLVRTEQVRRTWPFLRDRRIDHYGGLNELLLDPDNRSK